MSVHKLLLLMFLARPLTVLDDPEDGELLTDPETDELLIEPEED